MTNNLPAYAVVAIVLAVIGSATYLAAVGVLAGATVSALYGLALGAAGVTGGLHVAGNVIQKIQKGP